MSERKKDKRTDQTWGLEKVDRCYTVFPLRESPKVETRVLKKMMKGTPKDKRRATPFILAEEFLGMAQRLERELGHSGFRDIQKKLGNFQSKSLKEVIREILKER